MGSRAAFEHDDRDELPRAAEPNAKMTIMTGGRSESPSRPPVPGGPELFQEALVASAPHRRTLWQKRGVRISFVVHLLVLAALILVPIFLPSAVPEPKDYIGIFV